MPTGSFYSDTLTPDSRAGGSTSMTGTGAPSQPKQPQPLGWDPQFQGAWPSTPQPTAGGSGYTTGSGGQQRGMGQFPLGQGPSAVMPGPISQYPVAQYPSFNPLTGATSFVQSLYGPQQTLLDQQLARQQQQLGMVGLNADYNTSALRRDNSLAQQALGLDKQALGIDRNLTNSQLANLSKLKGLLGQQFGLVDRDLANRLKGFGIDEAKAKDMADREIFDLRSALTARGAFNTVANERGTGRISRDLMYDVGQINVGREGARIGAQGQRIGLQEKGLGYENQAAGLNAKLANIGLDTQRLGISEQQLANSLQDGLHQIGLDSMISLNGLLDAIGGTNMQQAQLASTILGEVAGYANLPPEVLRAMQTSIYQQQGLGGAGQTSRNTTGTLTGSRVPR